MPFEWLAKREELTPENLTIREQARLQENPNDLRWRAIFPRTDAPSIKLSELTTVDYRIVGGRREWNSPGREIVERLGPKREFEMVPINPIHHIDERRMQFLRERTGGVQRLIEAGIIKDVSTWPTALADAVDRQLERDAFEGWATGQITVHDPKSNATVVVSLGFDATRYVTAPTAWDDGGVDAYDLLLAEIENAVNKLGSIGAIRMRRATANAIVADAPTASPLIPRVTVANLQDLLSSEGFGEIFLVIDERTYDEYDDGGSAHTQKKYVPTGRVLFQPAGGRVGTTHFAPVTRAYDFIDSDRREITQNVVVFYTPKNEGKTLLIEAQANALPIPEEQFVYVVNAGV